MVAEGDLTRRADTLLRHSGYLRPDQARSFVCFPFEVPPGIHVMRIRFSFEPARVHRHRNLVTLSLFDPHGFRGAAHRHAPQQEILLGPGDATPGFLPGVVQAGAWMLELDCHAVLRSGRGGVEYELEVAGLPAASPPGASPANGAAMEAAGQRLAMELPQAPPVERGDGGSRPDATRPSLPGVSLTGEAQLPEPPAPAGWLRGDLHLHSNHSDGRWTAEDVAKYAQQYSLDFLAVTDHNTISGRADVERALRAAGLQTVLIPAMEITSFYGHANALGVTDWIDWRVRGPEGHPVTIGHGPRAQPSLTMDLVAAEVHRLGGTFIINHPRSAGYPVCTGCRWEFGSPSAVYADAIEVWNGEWGRQPQNVQALSLWNRWLSAGKRVPATAGTDSHGHAARASQLAFTYVWAAPTVPEILAAVRAGRSYLSCGPMLSWQQPELVHSVPAEVRRVVLDVSRLSAPADLQLIHNGQQVAYRMVAADAEVTVEIDLPAGGAGPRTGWYRAELYRRNSNELLAMTNPLYAD